MYINSKSWIFLFLFYGTVCFLMGFLGYWMKANLPIPSTITHGPANQEPNRDDRNLMAESEKYLAKFLTRLNIPVSNDPKTEAGNMNSLGKTSETMPVSANFRLAGLVFCFPERYQTGEFRWLIARYRFNLKTSFAGVKEIPIMEAERWDVKLAQILDREQPSVLIGFNFPDPGLNRIGSADSGFEGEKSGGDIHMYLAMADQWQQILLPQIMAKFCGNLKSFSFEKLKLGNREVLKMVWTETTGKHWGILEQNMESIIKTLEQVPELRTAQKI